jgi:hypothetical protein
VAMAEERAASGWCGSVENGGERERVLLGSGWLRLEGAWRSHSSVRARASTLELQRRSEPADEQGTAGSSRAKRRRQLTSGPARVSNF